jgi:hypothetical protein
MLPGLRKHLVMAHFMGTKWENNEWLLDSGGNLFSDKSMSEYAMNIAKVKSLRRKGGPAFGLIGVTENFIHVTCCFLLKSMICCIGY